MNKPLFWTVTGRDFGRSIAWAKKQPPNPLNTAILRKKAALLAADCRFIDRLAAADQSRRDQEAEQ
jgi:hypothetical protein